MIKVGLTRGVLPSSKLGIILLLARDEARVGDWRWS